MSHELYKKMIKEQIQYNEQTQEIPRGDIVELALQQLAILDHPTYNQQIEQYRHRKEELLKELTSVNTKLETLVNDCYKAILESL